MSNDIVETHDQIALDYTVTSEGYAWQYLSDVTLEDGRRVYVVETFVYEDEERGNIVNSWWVEAVESPLFRIGENVRHNGNQYIISLRRYDECGTWFYDLRDPVTGIIIPDVHKNGIKREEVA